MAKPSQTDSYSPTENPDVPVPEQKPDLITPAASHTLDSAQETHKNVVPGSAGVENAGAINEPSGAGNEHWEASLHTKLIIYVLAIMNLIASLDASMILTSLSTIAYEFEATTTQAFWIGTSYLLVNAVMVPVLASVGDIFGRLFHLMSSLVVFTIGTILCCTAHGITVMLVGRCIQGIGGGGIQSGSATTLTDIVPLRFRPKWYGVILAAWAVGLSIGPVIGGGIVQHTTWRWIFYIIFPLLGFCLSAVPLLFTIKPKTATMRERLLRVDWAGSALFIISMSSFLVALSWGDSSYAWNSAATLVPLVLGFLGIVATLIYEGRISEPLVRKSLFWNWSSICVYICSIISGIGMYGYAYNLPLYFVPVQGFDDIMTGVGDLPFFLAVPVADIFSGSLATRFNDYQWLTRIGWFITTVGCALTIVMCYQTSNAAWVMALIVLGIGYGLIANAQNFAIQAMCKPGDEGAAAAMYLFSRNLGFAIGVAVGSATFQNTMARKLEWEGLPSEIAYEAEAYLTTLKTSLDTDFRAALIEGYKYGNVGAYSVYLALAAVAFVITTFCIKKFDMNRKLDSEHKLKDHNISLLAQKKS